MGAVPREAARGWFQPKRIGKADSPISNSRLRRRGGREKGPGFTVALPFMYDRRALREMGRLRASSSNLRERLYSALRLRCLRNTSIPIAELMSTTVAGSGVGAKS